MNFVEKIFGTHSQHEVKRIKPILNKVLSYKESMMKLSDDELKEKTQEFRKRLTKGETLDDLLPEAYAVVREAAKRVLGKEHYPVQIIGGIILHQGRIAEMRTGEGKTLVSTLPAYLNALEDKGVYVITVNDYLAKRDSDEMGQVHRFLGLTVGVVLAGMTGPERREAYGCDITYVTNNELGFDYLRDNLAAGREQQVLRELNYCIIDEVDSVLIDEARTPLIISGKGGKATSVYEACNILAAQMERGTASVEELTKADLLLGTEIEETGDFVVNEKTKNITLTADGVEKAEKFFKLKNLADPENLEIQHGIDMALRAHNLMFKDRDYVVKDNEVLIVDEFTGRIMRGRRYSDGLHQAIEAKEHLEVRSENRTLATITFQNFFNKFKKKAGMTGTAQTEEKEFREIYSMDVISIPTNRPVQRIDMDDVVFKTKKEKIDAIVNDVIEIHKTGQPVLIGTVTIESSDELSEHLRRNGIKHSVLNAKNPELEAEIIAEAGRFGAVTIATNMAGRGTDIKVDEQSKKIGGLAIIGTERQESRRIDNQLRGRAGRQGEPGSSRFYLSLEDDVMRLFGSERLIGVFENLNVSDGEQIVHPMLSRAIEKAQMKIEDNNYAARKSLLEYDAVNNDQRELIYTERNKVLNDETVVKDAVKKMIGETAENMVVRNIGEMHRPSEWNLKALNKAISKTFKGMRTITAEETAYMSREDLVSTVSEEAARLYSEKEENLNEEDLRAAERLILLQAIDRNWTIHLGDMEQLKLGIGLQQFAQRNPAVEYRTMAFDLFDEMVEAIKKDTVRMLMELEAESTETDAA